MTFGISSRSFIVADIIYGVDFGTSNSAIAIMKDGQETVMRGRSKDDKTESSILFFPKWEMGIHYVGNEAIKQYIDSGMDGRLIQSIKSILPDILFNFTWIHGKKYEIDDLVSLIIRHLKKKADNSINADITKAVFGRPAVFSENPEEDKAAEQRLLSAALKAGFKEVHFQLEPIAAAFSYELRIDKPEIVLVADLGGGTSDFTIMRLDPKKVQQNNRTSDILATGGIHIAGNDFDSAVMWNKLVSYFGYGAKYSTWDKWLDLPVHIFRRLCQWERIPFLKARDTREMLRRFLHSADNKEAVARLITLIEKDLGFSLFKAIEEAKKVLSYNDSASIDFEQHNIIIHEPMTLSEFNKFIHEEVEKFENYLTSFISNAGLNDKDIDTVFITGGSSLVPALREIFVKKFGENKIRGGETFTSVASGLALSSVLFF